MSHWDRPEFRLVEDKPAEGERPLVVILHGYQGSKDTVKAVRDVVEQVRQNAQFWIPVMPHTRLSSFSRLSDTVVALKRRLDEIWKDGNYNELVVIGHSTGGPLARALYLAGYHAENQSEWVESLLDNGRIIMLAGMNRGWRISHQLSIKHSILWSFGALVGHFLDLFGRRLGLFDLRRGSLFLTKMRFDWLRARKTPLTIQLLGTIDDMVGPGDTIDMVTGKDFKYLDVPASGHTSVLEMNDGQAGSERADVLREALGPVGQMKEIRPWGLAMAEPDQERRESIKHVVFVIHGIRDVGFWTDKIARHIWSRTPKADQDQLERVTSSYGYFGMGPFLFPWIRRRKVEWLAEQVLETKSRYPNANRFSYVGHSNGTYLLAEALDEYGEIQGFEFDRVVFAGSVVNRHYNWQRHLSAGRVKDVLNIVATRDWVVAFFPQLFELIPIQNLGSAGHNGFGQACRVKNFKYASGGHSAGVHERFWDSIADYVLGKEQTADERLGQDPKGLAVLMRKLRAWAPFPVWLLLAVLLFVLVPWAIDLLWGCVVVPVLSWRPTLIGLAILVLGVLGLAAKRAYMMAPEGESRFFAALKTFTLPLALIAAVWGAAQAIGLYSRPLAESGSVVITLYFVCLLYVFTKV